ncbi:glycosyltransferase family 2 protein [Actinocrispum sp. NPDC049592]|uniref:glycosyltransferase family 2 protein n=1 Tax=Actinocrispum sp. NPDC049592 TaxID=3154835 RepID=UPI00342BC07A
MIDVVIPAHNEETLIRACIWSALGPGVQVIVVADGCTDDTVEAASLPGVTVISLPRSGKAAALNAAEPYRRGCPVVYLDADTVLTPGSLQAIASALDTPSPRLAGPAPLLVRPRSRLTRSFAKVWSALPAVAGQVIGGGCYAVNAAGRARWDKFPDVVADDAFVRGQFSPHEQALAGSFLLVLPEGRELISVVRRWRSGNAALPSSPSAGLRKNLAFVARKPSLWPHLPAFATVLTGRSRPGWSRASSLRPAVSAPIPPTVDAIVVTYNSANTIARCVDSIRSLSADVQITIVDNDSRDDTVSLVASAIRNPANIGFAAAVNQAARLGNGSYLLLVNPDAELHPGAIDHLLTLAARFPTVGLYGGRAITASGDLDPTTCLARPTLWHALAFATGLSATPLDPDSLGRWRRDDIRAVPALTGSMMLIRRDLWTELGGFDERYTLYGEDVDLCLRAPAPPMFTPHAVHLHHGGGSSTPESRLTNILRGKATLYAHHIHPHAPIALLAGVALRAAAGSRIWRSAWRNRLEWRHGWPASNTVRV